MGENVNVNKHIHCKLVYNGDVRWRLKDIL